MITLLTAAGTGAGWDVLPGQYPALTGAALTEPWLMPRGQMLGPPHGENWRWQGIGYPAAVFPMRPSVLNGWEECVRLVNSIPGKFVLDGYSQGALVVCMVWLHEIINPAGRLHHRLADCLGVITYGNPMRAPGIAYGNTLLWGKPVPGKDDGYTTGGIAGPADLKPEECLFPIGHPSAGKPAVLDFALPGDLYAAAPVGDTPWIKEPEVGANETLIYEAIMDFNGGDLFSFAKKVFSFATLDWAIFWGLFQAIQNGIEFLVAGPNAPHWQYDERPAVAWLTGIGERLA